MQISRLLAPALFVAIIGTGDPGFASVEVAAQFIDRLGNQAIETLRSRNFTLDQREDRFRGLLSRGFDLRFIGRFVLGKYWRRATPGQQSNYLALFDEFALHTYSARFGGYVGETLTVVGTRQANDKDVVVRTRIDRPNSPPIIADWRVRATGNRYRIIDVMIEGISLAVTQRSEFAAVVQRDGIEGLLSVLRARTTKRP